MKANNPAESRILFLVLVPLSLAILFAVIGFAFMAQGRPVVPLDLIDKFGYDFRDFHWAARYYLQGDDPWSWERFVTPPLSLFLVLPLATLPARLALQIFFLINAVLVLSGAGLFYHALIRKGALAGGTLLVFLAVLFSYPVFFLLHRGNIDGVIFFLIGLGLYLATRHRGWPGDLCASLAFAAACHLKIYPILLIVPILLMRRWRLFLLLLFWLVFLSLLTAGMWSSFYQKLLIRESGFKMEENGSLVNTFFLLSIVANHLLHGPGLFHDFAAIRWAAYLVFAGLLGLNILADYRQRIWEAAGTIAETTILYLPFMICLPVTVFHYEFILLLAMVPLLLRFSEEGRAQGAWPYLLAFGVVISQMHAGALFFLTENILAYYIPGFGLLLILAANLAVRSGRRRAPAHQISAALDAPP